MQALLTGSITKPELALRFGFGATIAGIQAREWIKTHCSYRWEAESQTWFITGLGPRPSEVLARAGISVDTSQAAGALAEVRSLDELVHPVFKVSSRREGIVLVRHRLLGFDRVEKLLGYGAVWDRATGRFEVPAGELVDSQGRARRGLILPESVLDLARAERFAHRRPPKTPSLASASSAAVIPEATNVALPDIPASFELDLYPFQHVGARAAAIGHRLIADPPGMGKTRIALGALAVKGAGRYIIVCPPVALSHWGREASQAGLGPVVVIARQTKTYDLPERGVVVVSDSLVAKRRELSRALKSWKASCVVIDEAHRLKTVTSARSRAIMDVVRTCQYPAYCLSGTPIMANPAELAPILDMCGLLYPVFGGYHEFLSTYTSATPFGKRVARKRALKGLKRELDRYCWLRRDKEEVLDLPAKVRHALTVDVDLTEYRKAHADILETIRTWLDQRKTRPSAAECEAWASGRISMLSSLRRSAGLAKIPAATEWIGNWLAAHPKSNGRYPRPLIVWVHHKDVARALREALTNAKYACRSIVGDTSHQERDEIIEAFQRGRIPVLIASITAAGVGITLTASVDALFVETDWTPGLIVQAEDRNNRVGSTAPHTFITTLVASGTLDEHIQRVLANKEEVLAPLLGEGQEVSHRSADAMRPADILIGLINDVLAG